MAAKSPDEIVIDISDLDEDSDRKSRQTFTIDRDVMEKFRNRFGNARKMSRIVEGLIRKYLEQQEQPRVVALNPIPKAAPAPRAQNGDEEE